jgi:superfamily II DNA/RNA helicase
LSASGSAEEHSSARYNLLDATRLRDQNFVALVLGGGDQQARERIFAGFNTPLLPEVLICTSVGSEGIDLHRHCRRIVHYDLAWNPAILEQRTGRVDRIGSKTFRERQGTGDGPSLEVGVPFLAGTYDERMFEELRMRAQTFEVLTGGDVAIDGGKIKSDSEDVSGADDAEGTELGLCLKSLPQEMLQDLRAKLHVWLEKPQKVQSDEARAYPSSSESHEVIRVGQPQQAPFTASGHRWP